MIAYYRRRYQITYDEKSTYFSNCLIVFTMQTILCVSVFYYMTNEDNQDTGFLASMHVDVMIPRFVCAILMHLASEPEVR